MDATLKVRTSSIAAAAQRLAAAAAAMAMPDNPIHPPLAADQTSVGAAARLNTAAEELRRTAAVHAAALTATASHLTTIAVRFAEQEAANSAAVRTMAANTEPIGSAGPLDAVPPVTADLRTPLPPAVRLDAETVARQLWAGTASAGMEFVQSWRTRAAAAADARDVIRDVAAAMPTAWQRPTGTAAIAGRLTQHENAFATVAARAAGLADQADSYAESYRGAMATTPNPSEFEDVQAQLRQALEANARFPGRYTPLVSSLIAKQGALRAQTLNTQSQYHEDAKTATDQFPAMLGAFGGVLGGAVAAFAQIPQALVQTGQQLAQLATQGLSGLATSAAHGTGLPTTEFDAAVPHLPAVPGGTANTGATTPAGAADMSPVAPATSSAPPQSTSLPQGAVPSTTVAAGGTGMMPTGMPLGMIGSPGAATAQQNGGTKKVVVPVVPHTESVTGRTAPERLSTATQTQSTRRQITVRTVEDQGL